MGWTLGSLDPCDHSWCERSPLPAVPPLPLTTARLCSRQDDDAAGKVASIGSVGSGILLSSAWALFWGTLWLAHKDCIVWQGSWAQRHIQNCTDVEHNRSFHGRGVAPDNLITGAYWAPGILSTAGLLGLNAISWEAVVEEGAFGDGVVACARVWTMASLCLLFGGFGLAIWSFVTDMQTPDAWHWGGVNTLIQNLLILFAAFLFRFVRRSGEHAI